MSDAGIELVAFVGLGAMGGPMCANLSRKSPVPTLAYDLDPNAVQAAVSSGSVAANDLADTSRADIVFICVPGEEQTRAVCLAEGGLCDHAKAGQIVVDCTTATVRVNLDVSEALATKGAHFADAPVARGVPNAHDGTLSITVGASEEIFNRIAPWLSYMGTDVAYCGPVGTGTVMKLMNNMVLFENVSALAEAMAIATRAGVPRSRVLDLLGQGSADSFALRRHGSFMTSGEYPTDRFPTTYSLKDLDYALDLADQVGVDAKGARLIRERFSEIVDRGMGHFYSPVVYELFEDE
ncbi:MAG: 2-hydroxy-3-oxopropionate reductase [Acidimicrobiaceae bacterium]|nr:2-hydroxy-3-oxopropionate reductase [Acidimicrobiaceae bacterium]|tara:strand:+ start:4418 stop:5302 length:885 start_codon:yes stop_codon:yes gene_type:complete